MKVFVNVTDESGNLLDRVEVENSYLDYMPQAAKSVEELAREVVSVLEKANRLHVSEVE